MIFSFQFNKIFPIAIDKGILEILQISTSAFNILEIFSNFLWND